MPRDWTYDLHVHGTTPRQLTLEALGELAKHFADLLGAEQHVRFAGLTKGSAVLKAQVLDSGLDAVKASLAALRLAQESSSKASRLDDYLRRQGWNAELRNREGSIILNFAGGLAANDAGQEVRVVKQVTTLVGMVSKIGGRDETVPMTLHLDSGEYLDVTVKGRDKARQLGAHLFGEELRFTGMTTWRRDEDGSWSCITMLVESFETLDGRPLESLFESLSEIPGNGWKEFDDPLTELSHLRGDEP